MCWDPQGQVFEFVLTPYSLSLAGVDVSRNALGFKCINRLQCCAKLRNVEMRVEGKSRWTASERGRLRSDRACTAERLSWVDNGLELACALARLFRDHMHGADEPAPTCL